MALHLHRVIVASLALAFGVVARPAVATPALPVDFTVEGRVYDAGGVPQSTPTDFKLEIVDEGTPACVLYRELRPNIDLSAPNANAQGVFSLRLGAVTPDFAATDLPTLLTPGSYAGDGCTATAAAGSHRLVRVSLRPSGGTTYETLTPDTRLTSVPMAMVAGNALSLQGVGTSSLLLLDPTSALTQPNVAYAFTATNYPRLKALLDGTSTQYLNATPTSAVGLNSQRLTNLADPTAAQDAATKHYADGNLGGAPLDVSAVGPMTGNARVLTWDATAGRWTAAVPNTTPTGSAGGDLTNTYPNPQVAPAAITTAKIADNAITAAKIANSGGGANLLLITNAGAGDTVGFGTCALNQVYAWTVSGWACTNVAALAPVTSVAGKTGTVLLNAGDIANLGSAALYDVGTAANKIVQLDASARLPAVDGSRLTSVNATILQSRPVANVTPGTGMVLGWNGSVWTPVTTSTGTVTSIDVGSGLTGGPTITTTGSIAVDAGTAANKIVQLNGSAQLPPVDGSLLTNVNTTRLQTRPVSATPPTSGQVLGWNGTTTTWEPTPVAASQWLTNSPNIYYSTGNVGIGTSTPAQPLTVVGTAQADGLLVGAGGAKLAMNTGSLMIQPTAANQSGQVLVAPSGLSTTAGLSVSASSAFGSPNTTSLSQIGANAALVNGSTGTLSLGSNGSFGQVVLTGAGRVGVGTNAPAAGLDVQFTGTANSALIVPRDTTANRPSTPVNGMLRYNTSLSAMEGYVNGAWAPISTGTSALSQWTTTGSNISYSAGNVGVGTTAPASPLQVVNSTAVTNANYDAANITTTLNPTGSTSGIYTGVNSVMTAAAPNAFSGQVNGMATTVIGNTPGAVSSLNGLYNTVTQAYNTGSANLSGVRNIISNTRGTSTFSYGTYNQVFNAGPTGTTINAAFGDYNYVRNVSSGSINAAVGSHSYFQNTGTGTINQAYGFYAQAPQNTNGGTIGTYYGLFIENPTQVTTGYSIWAAGGTAYLGGNVGVGSTTPQAALDVYAVGTASSAIIVPRDSTTNRPSAPVNGMLRYNTSTSALEGYVNGAWATFSSAANPGTVTNVGAGAGLLGGNITTSGTLSVDVGAAANKIVQENSTAQIAQTLGTAGAPSYSFAGDLNTGVFSPGANQLALSANGTTALLINAAGKVGLGTTTPGAVLQINGTSGGTLKIVDGNQAAKRVLSSDANGQASWADWGDVISPSMLAAGTYGSASQVPVFTTDAYGRVQGVTSTSIALSASQITSSLGYTPVNDAGDTMAGTLTTSGGLALGDNNLKSGLFSDGTNSGWRAVNGGTSDFSFQTYNNSATSMIVRNSGYVGIGTATPAERLHVNAPSGDAFIKATGYNAGCYMQAGASSAWNFTAVNGGNARIQVGGNTPAVWLQASGQVSLGTMTSNSFLTVAGTITPSASASYDLGSLSYLFKTVYASNGVINTSDGRLKKDVADADLGLDFVSSLRPVSFKWSNGVDDHLHYGLIAQEAEAALIRAKNAPDLRAAGQPIIEHDAVSDRYGVRYSELIAPIIRAVQELRSWLARVGTRTDDLGRASEAQARELARLRTENADLAAKVEAQARDLAAIKRRLGLD